MNVRPILDRWRSEAETFEARGMAREAAMVRSYAADLEAFAREYMFEALTLEQAAEERGKSYDTLQRWVSEGKIPNAGRKNSPRIRRCDLLPNLEPVGPRPVTDTGEPDLAEEVLRARR